MKALIRNYGETVTEDIGIEGIDWQTGAPLTNEAWCGGPYQLIQNYVPPVNEEIVEPKQVEDEDEYVVIDGKRYSKEELRALL